MTTPALPAPAPRDVGGMDDFEVIDERRHVAAALAALTDRYRQLNREVSTRDTLKWMLAELVTDPLEAELLIFKERVEFLLLLPEYAETVIPWRRMLGGEARGAA